MRSFLVRAEALVTVDTDDPNEAKYKIAQDEAAIAFQIVDIQVLPREYTRQPVTRDEIAKVEFPSTRHRSGFEDEPTIAPDASVTHPWDQGLWIFPEDHPLHEYERLARDKPITSEVEAEGYRRQKAAFLETAQQLALPAPRMMEGGDEHDED